MYQYYVECLKMRMIVPIWRLGHKAVTSKSFYKMAFSKDPIATSSRAAELSDGSDDKFQNVPATSSGSDVDIDAEEATRRHALAALTPAEEKNLLRRIDWHLMPLCSLIFMFKNLDVDNVSLR